VEYSLDFERGLVLPEVAALKRAALGFRCYIDHNGKPQGQTAPETELWSFDPKVSRLFITSTAVGGP
jgi:hypothetical protein